MSAWNRDPDEKTDWVGVAFWVTAVILVGGAIIFE